MDDFATGYLAGQDGGNNNGGFFGNEGLWAVIILAIIFGWGNYGNGRNGGDNAISLAIMQEGNARQAGQTAIQTQLASCCCENKQLIGDLKYTIAQQDCATRQAIADNARAIVDNCNANFRSMMDYFTQDKIATLTAENQSLKFAASQDRQNALLTTVMSQQTDTILSRVNPRPIPAYQVANPNVGVNCCGCC